MFDETTQETVGRALVDRVRRVARELDAQSRAATKTALSGLEARLEQIESDIARADVALARAELDAARRVLKSVAEQQVEMTGHLDHVRTSHKALNARVSEWDTRAEELMAQVEPRAVAAADARLEVAKTGLRDEMRALVEGPTQDLAMATERMTRCIEATRAGVSVHAESLRKSLNASRAGVTKTLAKVERTLADFEHKADAALTAKLQEITEAARVALDNLSPGTPGNLHWTGSYTATKRYFPGDLTIHKGTTWVCTREVADEAPAVAPQSAWEILAAGPVPGR